MTVTAAFFAIWAIVATLVAFDLSRRVKTSPEDSAETPSDDLGQEGIDLSAFAARARRKWERAPHGDGEEPPIVPQDARWVATNPQFVALSRMQRKLIAFRTLCAAHGIDCSMIEEIE